ncbi:MAG: SH3 domain-containing protein [Anaerolineae bacterium]
MTTQFKLRWPVDNPRITQYFGENPQIYNRFNMPGHEGMDFGIAIGTNLYACADGAVADVRTDTGHPYGIFVRINHSFGDSTYQTIYAHMSKAMVSKGQSVKAGDVIGLSGNTGHSFGPHLHFTLKLTGAQTPGYPAGVVDPNPYFQPSEPLEPSDLTIYVADRVRLRSGPTTASTHLAWMDAGEALVVLGDADKARAQVGQEGQWIPVRRANGMDGYTAAWYLQLKSAGPAPSTPKPEPEPAPAGALTVYATQALNIRKGASVGTARVAIALPNDPLTVAGDASAARAMIGDRGEWLQVRLPSGSKGYAAAWYVQAKPGAEPGLLLTVAPTEDMNMRERPTTVAGLVGRILQNTLLTVHDDPTRAGALVGRQGEWLYVETPEKQRGWVAAWYVQSRPASFAAPELPPAPTEPVVVYATETLHVHRGLSLDTNRVAIVLPHEALTTLGDPRAALSRLGQKGEWLEVRLPDESKGYIPAWLAQTEAGFEPALLLTVSPLVDIEMFRWPSVSAKRFGQLARGTSLTVHDDLERAEVLVGRYDEWLYVATEEGERGWVPAWYVSEE